MSPAPRKIAFTLVELLVVITIIVLLLALLAPAMDQAIYQAELAVCGAQKRAVGTGAIGYAMDYKRHFPDRRGVYEQMGWPSNISTGQPQYDDRPKLRPYFALNETLVCPLIEKVDIEGADPDTIVFSTYNLWFGFQYRRSPNSTDTLANRNVTAASGMLKLGDRWGWYDDIAKYTLRSSLMAGTRLQVAQAGATVSSTHPGNRGTYTIAKANNDNGGTIELTALGPVFWQSAKFTFVRWDSTDMNRGEVDMNGVFDDLSVRRYDRVGWLDDRRTARVAAWSNGWGWPNSHEVVPIGN